MFSRDSEDEIPISAKNVIATLAGTGILGVIAAGMLAVANDARVAINVAEQHGEELLLIRGELSAIRNEMLQRTEDRYTSRDAAAYERYIEQRLAELERRLEEGIK